MMIPGFTLHHLDPRSWPIRWRLTALNVGVLMATLALFGGVSLWQLDRALITITGDHLKDQIELVIPSPGRGPGLDERRQRPSQERGPGGVSGPGGGGGPPIALGRVAPELVRRLSGPDTGVLVFDLSGNLASVSDWNEDVEAWPRPSREQLSGAVSGREYRMVVDQETRRALVLLLPLRTPDGQVVGALELARSLELTDYLEERLRLMLLAGTSIAAVVAGGVTLRATRAALGPLDRVVQAARRIEAGALNERLRLHRRDEIGDLAEAFDSMLDRIAVVLAAQRRFVADAAHELRTPLTALGGMVEMLQLGADRGDPATVRRMLDTMDRELGRLGRLVADLLTLSRLDSEQPLAAEPVELAPLVADVAQQTRLLSHGQHIRERIDGTPVVRGDADRLRQVLINLASNALAFTPAGGTIEFQVERSAGQARMVVADTGSGIAPDLLPRVMDRFARGDVSRARSTGGSGLGLAIARDIVDAHGGTIALESTPGHGTRAIVTLPAWAGAAPTSEHRAPARSGA
ncbi:MAG: HAMP domain-containing protein [Chloroflexi bacterium]|nr:HAMP domain-containing protein [Chloroflexota bacterium]